MKTSKFFFIAPLIFILSACIKSGQGPSFSAGNPTITSIISQSSTPNIVPKIEKATATKPIPEPTYSPTENPTRTITQPPLKNTQTGELLDFPGGKLYFWDDHSYGFLDFDVFPYLPQYPELNFSNVITFGFSQSSNQTSVISAENGINLWLSDLALDNPFLAWVDKGKWLGDIRGDGEFDLYWGPNDQYIIIKSRIEDQRILVYSLVDDEVKQFEGNCSSISRVQAVERYEITCFDEPNNQYFALTWDDGFLNLEQLDQVISSDVMDWVYWINGEMILYTDRDGDVYIVDQSGQVSSMKINT